MTDDRWLLTDEERAARGMGPWTKLDDPAHALLTDGFTSTPKIHKKGCYICEDPEFAQMGLPLCRVCPRCGGHIAADDCVCDDCGLDEFDWYLEDLFRVVRDQPHSLCRGDKDVPPPL